MSDRPVVTIVVNGVEHRAGITCWCLPVLDVDDDGRTLLWRHHSVVPGPS